MTLATQTVDFKIVERIQKLLNLAAKNPNKAEADAAAAKAQELLTQYNLDAASETLSSSSAALRSWRDRPWSLRVGSQGLLPAGLSPRWEKRQPHHLLPMRP